MSETRRAAAYAGAQCIVIQCSKPVFVLFRHPVGTVPGDEPRSESAACLWAEMQGVGSSDRHRLPVYEIATHQTAAKGTLKPKYKDE